MSAPSKIRDGNWKWWHNWWHCREMPDLLDLSNQALVYKSRKVRETNMEEVIINWTSKDHDSNDNGGGSRSWASRLRCGFLTWDHWRGDQGSRDHHHHKHPHRDLHNHHHHHLDNRPGGCSLQIKLLFLDLPWVFHNVLSPIIDWWKLEHLCWKQNCPLFVWWRIALRRTSPRKSWWRICNIIFQKWKLSLRRELHRWALPEHWELVWPLSWGLLAQPWEVAQVPLELSTFRRLPSPAILPLLRERLLSLRTKSSDRCLKHIPALT